MSKILMAADVALQYYNAWVVGDLDKAMFFIGETFSADAPRAGRITSRDVWRATLQEYLGILESSALIAAHGSADSALMLYTQDTKLFKGAPTAEHFLVQHGKITYIRVIFDRTPFEAARRQQQKIS